MPENGALPDLMTRFYFVYAAWVTAFAATLGSLFFGEVMGLPICTLCWYQRMALYPLVVLLPTAILMRDRRVNYYALPLVLIGLGMALYRNLLYYGLIARNLAPCVPEVPCTARQIEWLGFLTIPLMSLGAFALILVCLTCFAISSRKAQ